MNKKILSLENISKDYYNITKEIKAINNISFDIYEGEIIAVVGPSGCGKSSLLNIIGNLEEKTSGNIIYPDGFKKIGYMFQTDCLFPWLNILDNCLLGIKVYRSVNDDDKDYVINLLHDYGLGDFIYSYPNSLSGGMRQRVALIRTLVIKPDILLLDEPFSALDSQSRLVVCDDVYKIIKKEHKTTIIITHDIGEAISVADRVVILSNRPSCVKKVVDINLTNKSSPIKNRECIEFNSYYNDIWESIDHDFKGL